MKFRQSVKILISIFVLLFSFSLSFSQNCGTTQCAYFGNLSDKEYKKKLDINDVIFYGEIISQSEILHLENGFPYRKLRVKVLEAWKGVESNEVEIDFSYYDNDCANLGESGEMIFYGYSPTHQSPFNMGWCNKYSFKDEKTRKILGEGKVIEQTQPSPTPTPTESTEDFWSSLWKKITSFFS